MKEIDERLLEPQKQSIDRPENVGGDTKNNY